jgi:hypothetical protein
MTRTGYCLRQYRYDTHLLLFTQYRYDTYQLLTIVSVMTRTGYCFESRYYSYPALFTVPTTWYAPTTVCKVSTRQVPDIACPLLSQRTIHSDVIAHSSSLLWCQRATLRDCWGNKKGDSLPSYAVCFTGRFKKKYPLSVIQVTVTIQVTLYSYVLVAG